MSTNSPPTSPVSSASGDSTSATGGVRQAMPTTPARPVRDGHPMPWYERRERGGDYLGRRRLLWITVRATTVIGGEGSVARSGRWPPRRAKPATSHRVQSINCNDVREIRPMHWNMPSVRIQRRCIERRLISAHYAMPDCRPRRPLLADERALPVRSFVHSNAYSSMILVARLRCSGN
jgi:hypothetical protein